MLIDFNRCLVNSSIFSQIFLFIQLFLKKLISNKKIYIVS